MVPAVCGIVEWMSMEHLWSDSETGKLKYLERNLSHYHFIHHMSRIDCLGMNPDLCDKRPTYNRINHYTAQKLCKNCIQNGDVKLEFIYPLLFPVKLKLLRIVIVFQLRRTKQDATADPSLAALADKPQTVDNRHQLVFACSCKYRHVTADNVDTVNYASLNQCTHYISGVPKGGVWGVQTPPEIPKISVESSNTWARRTGVSISFCSSLCSHKVVIY